MTDAQDVVEAAAAPPAAWSWRLACAYHAAAAVATAVAGFVSGVLAFVATFGLSYCSLPPAQQEISDARATLLVIVACWTSVPAMFAFFNRARRPHALPWTVVATAIALFGVYESLRFEPAVWCF